MAERVPIMNRIYVLEAREPILLLGRQFLRQFGRVAFNWDRGTIELGQEEVPILATDTGGDPLGRSRAIMKVEPLAIEPEIEAVNEQLKPAERDQIKTVLDEFRERVLHNLSLRDGHLYFDQQIVVPKVAQQEVMTKVHGRLPR